MARGEDWDDYRDDGYDRWWEYAPSRPLAAKGGIKARNQRGAFTASWWGRRWLAVLESLGLGGRLARGRSYARSGQVISLEIKQGLVAAAVQGSRKEPYRVRISLKIIEPPQRAALSKALAADLSLAAAMLGGELPTAVEQCFEQAGAPLFPRRLSDLVTWCSCPDSSNPCKHVAAVCYLLAEEFDRDPFLLLTIRGIGRDQFMAMLGSVATAVETGRDAEPAAPETQPLSSDPQNFWRAMRLPDHTYAEVAPIDEAAPMARRLGPFPLWRGDTDFMQEISRRSRAAVARALELLAEKPANNSSE